MAMPQVTGTVTTIIPKTTTYTSLQGGTTDGTSWYAIRLDRRDAAGKTKLDDARVIKTPLGGSQPTLTRDFTSRSGQTNQLGHGNDIAYNSRTDRLLVPARTWDASIAEPNQNRLVRLLKPTDLTVAGTVTFPYNVSSIAYEPNSDRYVAGTFGAYHIYNGSYVALTTKAAKVALTGVGQGIDCDANYIYVISSASTDPATAQTNNRIFVLDWNFALLRTYEYPSPLEVEHILHTADEFYLGMNDAVDTLVRLDRFQYTVRYAAGGGTKTMAPTPVLYGVTTKLRKNAFTRAGYTFAGWTARRACDAKMRYRNPADSSQDGWYAVGGQPTGWEPFRYSDQAPVSATAPRGVVTMTATWRAA